MARAKLDRMWSPWRMRYIRTADAPAGCLFCGVHRARDDRRHLVLARRAGALLMMNRYPYNPAHLMVAVRRHAARFTELEAGESADLLALTALAERLLEREYAPHGMNYGVNVGQIAGAGFPGHLHLHLVPRWSGDTNFMSTIAESRVLPESLGATWRRLRAALRAMEKEAAPGRSRKKPTKAGAQPVARTKAAKKTSGGPRTRPRAAAKSGPSRPRSARRR